MQSRIQNPKSKIALAVLFIGLAAGYALSGETPVGSVEGRIVLADMRKGIEDVRLAFLPLHDVHMPTRYVRSRSDGRFSLKSIGAGKYQIAADTRVHELKGATIIVTEGDTSTALLVMTRTQPTLELAQHQWTFTTDETPRIAATGYANPAAPGGKDTLRLKIFRTRLSNVLISEETEQALSRVGQSWNAPPGLPAILLKPPSGPKPELVSNTQVPLTAVDREGFFYQRIGLGKLPLGLYLLEIAHDESTAKNPKVKKVAAWALVSDTAIVLKQSSAGALAFTADLRTGKPLPGTRVQTYQGGRRVAESVTDSRGLAEFKTPESTNQSRPLVVAVRGQDEAVIGHASYDSESGGRYAAYIYTDRPIYRPGHLIHYKGIVRKIIERSNRHAVPSSEPVSLEIRDPNGEVVASSQHATSAYGSFSGRAQLPPEAPTGVYSIIANVGGEEHTQDIVIASYRKPEFSVTIIPDKQRYVRGDEMRITISARYYFGAPAAGAHVRYSVYRSPDWAAGYHEDYGYEEEFDSAPYRENMEAYYGEVMSEMATILDENGRAEIIVDADVKDDPESPQEVVYTISATVTDDAQRESEADGEVRVVAGDFKLFVQPEGYVGEPNKPTLLTVTAKDHDRNPVRNTRITLQPVYQVWQNDKYERIPFAEQSATTDDLGRAQINLTPTRSGELRITATAADSSGRRIYASSYLWVSSDAGGELATEYTDLSLLTDKRRYDAGDTARVLINTSRTGQTILMTVEGERVYKSILIPALQKSTVMRIPVLAEYGPNVYLSACYVQKKHFASSQTPLRVTMPKMNLKVAVRADKQTGANENPKYKPGENISYTVTTANSEGKPVSAEVSLGVVDEAIYALREDNPAALREAFFPWRYSRVQTRYSFAVQYLGDANKAEPKIAARSKFKDTAYWNPAVKTDAAGRATVSFNLPDNLTTWRATAVGHTMGTAVGRDTTKIVSTKEFLVRVDTPRFFTQNDQARISAFIHNDTGAKQKALVRLRANGLTIQGDETKTLSVESGAAAEAFWNITARDIGDAKVTVTAWTPQTGSSTQFTDGVELKIPVRAHGRERFQTFTGALDGVDSENEILRVEPNSIPGSARLTIRLNPSVGGAVAEAMDYLLTYPYACTEQTMSRFIPALLVNKGLDPSRKSEAERYVRQGIARLYELQHESGAWGWWEHDADDAWMTAYVLYGLGIARSQGYAVNPEVLRRGIERAKETAKAVQPENRAFLIYAIAQAGDRATAESLRGFVDVRGGHPESLAYTVLLNKALGNPAPTQISTATVMQMLDAKAVTEGDQIYFKSVSLVQWGDLATTAAGLRAILAVNPQDSRITSVLRWIMLQRNGQYWSSTRDTAAVLTALADYLSTQPAGSPGGQVNILLNGQPLRSVVFEGETLRKGEMTVQIPAVNLQSGKNEITLQRTSGTGAMFYSMQLRQTVATEEMAAEPLQGLNINREYLNIVPRRLSGERYTLAAEPTNNILPRAAQIRVRLTIECPRDLDYVLIEDSFPAGCEVTQRGTADEEVNAVWNYWWSHVDVRDEKIAFFARSMSKGKHVIEYNLRAQTPGSYHVLPAFLEPMYQPDIHAESAESRVEVRQ